jgi:dihydroflavonol-4-reductase
VAREIVFVTGGTGFLGRSLVPSLVEKGFGVRALVRPGSEPGWEPGKHVEVVQGDVTDPASLSGAMDGCRYLIHAAALFRFWGREGDFFRVNLEGTKNIVSAAVEAGVSRIIYISTIAVVGIPKPGELIDESIECRPQTGYQRSKCRTERWLLSQARENDLPVVVLRPGAFYGPGSSYGFNRLFVIEAMRGWRVRVEGGERLIFPVYVPDVAAAAGTALTKAQIGQLYNICDRPYTHNQVNDIASHLLGIGTGRWNVPKWVILTLAWFMEQAARISGREPFYPLNLRHYVFNDWNVTSEKAARELDFIPTPIEQGLAATVDWLRSLEGNG